MDAKWWQKLTLPLARWANNWPTKKVHKLFIDTKMFNQNSLFKYGLIKSIKLSTWKKIYLFFFCFIRFIFNSFKCFSFVLCYINRIKWNIFFRPCAENSMYLFHKYISVKIEMVLLSGTCNTEVLSIKSKWLISFKRVRIMLFNATFNNISAISWLSVLLVEETRVPQNNNQPVGRHW